MARTALNKTRPTDADVDAYLGAIDDPLRRADVEAIDRILERATGEPARMWGTGIVGHGRYRYRYASGREGEACLAGWAARKDGIAIYLMAGFDGQPALLARLGRHRMGKACLTIRALADVDPAVLEALVQGAVDETRRRHGRAAEAHTP